MGCMGSKSTAAGNPKSQAAVGAQGGNNATLLEPNAVLGGPTDKAQTESSGGVDMLAPLPSRPSQSASSGSQARHRDSRPLLAPLGGKPDTLLAGHLPVVQFWGATWQPPNHASRLKGANGDVKNAYAKAADAAAGYVAARVLNDDWVARHQDICYYFKAPLALLEAGRKPDAEKALSIAARYVYAGVQSSSNDVYATVYPQYPLLWVCWAASRLGSVDVAKQCFSMIAKFVHPFTGSGLVGAPYESITKFEADFFATAIIAKAAMLVGDINAAKEASDSLLRAVDANRGNMQVGRFNLRWTWKDGLCQEEDVLHCVQQKGSGQLFFMLGFPAVVLLEMAAAGEGPVDRYKAGGQELLGFLKGCAGVHTSAAAHQVAYAAALAQDDETASRIAENVLTAQRNSGCFNDDPEVLYVMDQTAEISVWLRQLSRRKGPALGAKPITAQPRPSGGGATGIQPAFSMARPIDQSVADPAAAQPAATAARRAGSEVEVPSLRTEAFGGSAASSEPAQAGGSGGRSNTEHTFVLATFSQPTWCSECVGFLWGWRQQGMRCDVCKVTVCESCVANLQGRSCRGSSAQL